MPAPVKLSMLGPKSNPYPENNVTNVIEFLSSRRSVTAKTMAVGKVDPSHLDQILTAGIRVPDHGALKPWKLVVISGAARARLDSEIIHAEFTAANPDAKPEVEEIEKGRLQRADVVVAVLSTPVEHPKIDVWEMQLSAGAVCTTLLYAAQSFGYAAQWLTEWYAYSDRMLTELGGRPGLDRIAGFIYIGEKIKPPIERTRPDPDKVITRL
ncbi:MAG: nitroreductase [Pseudomonadota bacterium]|nr:nitroreductase [Pseudomonadota bacterium]